VRTGRLAKCPVDNDECIEGPPNFAMDLEEGLYGTPMVPLGKPDAYLSDPVNWRGIALLPHLKKMFEACIVLYCTKIDESPYSSNRVPG
jgi:hypothetical protein